jgi:hypothetical protein
MTEDPRDFIDWDEGRDFPSPFYALAEPCESCGEPTFKGRIWNAEHELWIAVDCSCNAPDMPTCPNLVPLIVQANTVREIVRVCKEHRASCSLCGPVEIRRPAKKKPAKVEKEAA